MAPEVPRNSGKCEPAKHGHFEDAGCTKEKYKEKGGVRSYKGKYEWLAAQVELLRAEARPLRRRGL